MNLSLNYTPSQFFMAVFFILFAVNAFGWIAVSAIAFGIVALIIAILIFVHR